MSVRCDDAGVQLLATGSRDRLVHIFDIDHDYSLVQTLDDHSSAITAVRFTELDSQLMMLSCGADKSLLFRNAQLVCYIFIFFFTLELFYLFRNNIPWCFSCEGIERFFYPVY